MVSSLNNFATKLLIEYTSNFSLTKILSPAFENSFDSKAFQLMKYKVATLLEDFEKFYGPKGRGLSIAIHVQKENSADRFSETFPYTDDLSIVHIVDIGTKGKYEPVVTKIDEKMIEEEKKKVAKRNAQRKK